MTKKEKSPEIFPPEIGHLPRQQGPDHSKNAVEDAALLIPQKNFDTGDTGEAAELLKFKEQALQVTKDWETHSAKPLTMGYKVGEKAISMIPPADADLMQLVKSALGPFGNNPKILNEFLGEAGIQTDNFKVLVYTPSQKNASEDTIATFTTEKYENVSLDPITGKLRITAKRFTDGRPGDTARYSHLFKVQDE